MLHIICYTSELGFMGKRRIQHQNVLGAAKAVPRGKLLALNASISKGKSKTSALRFYVKKLEKEEGRKHLQLSKKQNEAG